MNRIVHHQPTMTSREIADLTGSPHDAVLKTVRRLVAEGIVSANDTPYTNEQNGQTYREFLLSFRDTMVIVSGYSAELRAKIIDRWQELESGAAPAARMPVAKPPVMVAAGMVPGLARALRSLGIEKNAAAIGANQIATAHTGVNLLALAGHTHLVTPTQDICYTPTELGNRRCVKAHTMNRAIADAGLQERIGSHWVPTEKGAPHAVVLDTGKVHGSGAMIQQVKWRDSVLAEIAL